MGYEWVYNDTVYYDYTAQDMVWVMLDDEENEDVQNELFEWLEDFGENNPETTLLDFIKSYCKADAKVSDMMHDMKALFVDYLAHRPALMECCGAELRDLDSERDEWRANNSGWDD